MLLFAIMNALNGIDIGKRAMMISSESIRVAGQNITNATADGYSRQKLELKTAAYDGGIKVNTLRSYRARDKFVDENIRRESQTLGNWDMQAQLFGQVEEAFLEPSEYGLNATLSQFWNSWADLANDPQGVAPRSVVIQQGSIVAESFRSLDSQLLDLRDFANSYVENRALQINDMATEIARANTAIVGIEASGAEASEIRDSRDLLLAKLSKMTNITSVERESGSIAVMIGGRAIVDDDEVFALKTEQIASADGRMQIGNIIWEQDGAAVQINSGELFGLTAIRDTIIPEIQSDLNDLVSTLITEVNNRHSVGYGSDGTTGLDFFIGADASDIEVNPALIGNINALATSASGEPGDNAVALLMADMTNATVTADGKTIGASYSGILEELGAESHSAAMMKENSEMLLNYLDNQKETVSGVSLDEETADLIRFQRAYQSAAHYMSVIDELLETIMQIR